MSVGTDDVESTAGGMSISSPPPGFADTLPDGYLHLPSNNYQGHLLLRSILKRRSEADIASAGPTAGARRWPVDGAAQPATPDPLFMFIFHFAH
jgi:hypothetical protein